MDTFSHSKLLLCGTRQSKEKLSVLVNRTVFLDVLRSSGISQVREKLVGGTTVNSLNAARRIADGTQFECKLPLTIIT